MAVDQSSYTCAHGYAWIPRGTACAECDAERERPHAADPAAVRLDPGSTLKHWICRRCTQSPDEDVHERTGP
ncbi:hypothetical protein [Streptomyces sp. NPDC101132]|uniref:hypothetical protein n=1 Tax=Streptomyces sp. NPDC101132 TaxID=3366110 RepID=UPI00382CFACB